MLKEADFIALEVGDRLRDTRRLTNVFVVKRKTKSKYDIPGIIMEGIVPNGHEYYVTELDSWAQYLEPVR